MSDILELSDRIWRGEAAIEDHHPFGQTGALAEISEGVAFIPSFANVSVFETEAGLVLVDTGSQMFAAEVYEQIRSWSKRPVHTAIYSHGHIDHVFGISAFDREAREGGVPLPRVVAHAKVPVRFERYKLTAGYNGVINRRQFRAPGLQWPVEYRYPDETFEVSTVLEIGGLRFELRHARGETDDHTWTWVPERAVLCCGDFFIWAAPNAGNPQKVQRYPREWALALREMSGLGAEILLPGHGLPLRGADRIRRALGETADLLESIVEQTLALMNEGARLDEIIHTVAPPPDLLDRPYLRPIYDEPEFIVRNVWRLYGGWWDGNPANLKPPPDAVLASEIAALAGGAAALAARALALAESGDLRLAGHLAEMATLAAPADPEMHRARAEVFERRAHEEPSTMSRGIFSWAASESRVAASKEGR